MRISTTVEVVSWINAKARTSETITTTSKNLKPIYIRQGATEIARSVTEYGYSSEGKPTPEIQTDSDGKEADAAGIQPERIG